MKKFQIVCYIIGVSQLALGLLYLFVPGIFMNWQGLNVPPADTSYPLAMLAGRFLVYGVGMFVIARQPATNKFWFDGMIAIQAIDLAAGLFYTLTGVVPIAVSGIALFDAALFIALMVWVRKDAQTSNAGA